MIFSKTRRRGDKGDGTGGDGEEQKLYLQDPLLENRVPPEPDLTFLTDLPGGLDYNEWLASHSKLKNRQLQYQNQFLVLIIIIFLKALSNVSHITF